MKNKIIILITTSFLFFFNNYVFGQNIYIESKSMDFDKKKQISIFKDRVIFKTEDNKTIKSEYAEYNKKDGLIVLKDQVILIDQQNNRIEAEYAEYYEKRKLFISKGPTKIITDKGYVVVGKNFILDNAQSLIKSNDEAIIKDNDENTIYLENFEFLNKQNIFKSIGLIKVKDNLDNTYEFSQIYIDTVREEILGTDIKAFINNNKFKVNPDNKPRIFANSVNIDGQKSIYNKSIFTLCNYRENDKCPPWSIQSTKMLHDNKKKTIYYDNALVKIYDIPIFYFPKLSHPDPTVERRSGFLPPSISDTKNLGSSASIPYFFAINNEKNLTLTSRIFTQENPLFLGEYQQAFRYSTLFADFGYTEGYNKTSATKKPGQKSHLFAKFLKNVKGGNNSENNIEASFQDVSNDKYFKLYKIESNLVDYNTDVLENSIAFTRSDEDFFFRLNASVFETLKENYTDKYEYILPELFLVKNLFNNNLGNLNLQSNLKVRNYDTNKVTKFLVNDFEWKSKDILSKNGVSSRILGQFKNVNYEANNVDLYKEEFTNEAYGAIGFLSELKLQKDTNSSKHFLTPRILLRYAPGSMRKEENGSKLDPIRAFNMNKLDNINNFETGLSSSVGLNYKVKNKEKEFNFSVAQVISEKENKQMSSKSSLDEKLSDLVASSNFKLNDNVTLKYDLALDQNYSETNYNDFGLTLNYDNIKVDFNYLQEDKHIGNQEYFKTKIDLAQNKNGLISFETKRDLLKNSSEFYNLSYEYINDCLRAGLVYRREFYNDSELEPENSLMFKVTLTPFGKIDSPTFSK